MKKLIKTLLHRIEWNRKFSKECIIILRGEEVDVVQKALELLEEREDEKNELVQ